MPFRDDIDGLGAANGSESGTSVGWGWRGFAGFSSRGSAGTRVRTIDCTFYRGDCRLWAVGVGGRNDGIPSGIGIGAASLCRLWQRRRTDHGMWHDACIEMNGCDRA